MGETLAPDQLGGLKAFLSGGIAGTAYVICNHPFDTLKVRFQTSNAYTGLVDCVRKTGFRGLYRGMSSPLLGITPTWAISFWSYELGQQIIQVYKHHSSGSPHSSYTSQPLTYFEYALAGAFAGIPINLTTTPIERLKILMQTQDQRHSASSSTSSPASIQQRQRASIIQTTKHVLQTEGIRGLYRGAGATLIRDIPGAAAYYVTYEYVSRSLGRGGGIDDLAMGAVLVAGGCAGVAQWTVSIPPDVIKSRIQAAPVGMYRGFADALVKTLRQDGPRSLFRGWLPAVVTAFPVNAVALLARSVSLAVM